MVSLERRVCVVVESKHSLYHCQTRRCKQQILFFIVHALSPPCASVLQQQRSEPKSNPAPAAFHNCRPNHLALLCPCTFLLYVVKIPTARGERIKSQFFWKCLHLQKANSVKNLTQSANLTQSRKFNTIRMVHALCLSMLSVLFEIVFFWLG